MNVSSVVHAVASVGVAYVAVKNTKSLTEAVVAYFVGAVVVHYVLSMVVGLAVSSPIDVITLAAIAYVFYNKYNLTGVLAALVAPTVLSFLLIMLGIRF
jgi:hypothetical protein